MADVATLRSPRTALKRKPADAGLETENAAPPASLSSSSKRAADAGAVPGADSDMLCLNARGELVLSAEARAMTVEEFFTRAKDELVRSVLRRADAAVSQLRAHFEREKAALVEAVASRAAEDDATAKQGDKMTVDVRLEVIEGPYAGKVFVLHPRAVREGFLPGVKDSRHDPVRSYPPRALAVRTRVTVAQKVVPKIGRSTGRPFVKMGVSLPEDPEVSTTHGKFEARGGKVFFADLGSTNGTSLNAEDLTPHVEYELRDGDKLRVGATKMAVTVMVAEG